MAEMIALLETQRMRVVSLIDQCRLQTNPAEGWGTLVTYRCPPPVCEIDCGGMRLGFPGFDPLVSSSVPRL